MLLVVIFILGCSSGDGINVTTPDADIPQSRYVSDSAHASWGLWQFAANLEAGTLDVVQLRTGNLHLNALPFLEPPPLVNLTLESVEFNGNIIETDIGLRHPFLGLNEFTGFDVCGIIITNGSVSGFDDPDLQMAGEGDTRLLNPDGFVRWWNPAEFPVNTGTIFGYNDGLLGAPDSYADYNSTLNAYKYFCDDLNADDLLSNVTLADRGMFSAGQKNIRHYTIELGDEGLIFNYAVDASWIFPDGSPPYQAPDNFPPGANRPEAYRLDIDEVENTLWAEGAESGGDLKLLIDVYDWFDAGLNTVQVESPGNFDPETASIPVDGGAGYSTYQVDIVDAYPITTGTIDLLITVESEAIGYGGLLPGEPVCAYFTASADVSGGEPVTAEWGQLQNHPSHTGDITGDTGLHPPLELSWCVSFDTLTNPTGLEGTPIVGDGKILVFYSYNSTNWAECRSLDDGTFLWNFDLSPGGSTTGMASVTGCYADGRFFAPGSLIRAFDPETGTVLWEYAGHSAYENQRHGLVYDDGRILVHLSNRIHIIDAETGVAIDVVNVYSGYANFQPFTLVDEAAYYQLNGSVWATDLSTGSHLWHFPVDPPISGIDVSVRGSLTVPGDGKVYFGCYNFYFYALDQATGNLEWKIQMNGGTQRYFRVLRRQDLLR